MSDRRGRTGKREEGRAGGARGDEREVWGKTGKTTQGGEINLPGSPGPTLPLLCLGPSAPAACWGLRYTEYIFEDSGSLHPDTN